MSVPSLGLGKRHGSGEKPWKPITKLCKAIKKASRRVAALLFTRSSAWEQTLGSTSPYSAITSLSECPCNYHRRQRRELQQTAVAKQKENHAFMHDILNQTPAERGDVEELPAMTAISSESVEAEARVEDEKVDATSKWDLVERHCSDMVWPLQAQEVDKRADSFIKSFREDLKLQRQRSMQDFYSTLAQNA